MQNVLCALALLFGLSGCGFFGILGGGAQSTAEAAASGSTYDSIELYLARASLLETQFEQYRLSGTSLYYECGEIRRARNRVALQRLGSVSAEEAAKIDRLAREVEKSIPPSGAKSIDEPGDLNSFADSGQFYLTLRGARRVELKTSLDAVDASVGSLDEYMKKLAVRMRSAAREQEPDKKLCGNVTFYGLPG